MKTKINLLLSLLCMIIIVPMTAQAYVNNPSSKVTDKDLPKLENPMSVQYLKKNLRKSIPRLILNSTIERNLKKKLKTDPLVQSYYKYLEEEANQILTEPLLTRKFIGHRLLGTSTEMVNRMGVLSMVYRIGKDPEILKRIDAELNAVCNFSDWNPVHFLDVAEMSFAVALATDWVGEALPQKTVKLAKTALIEKGILPSYVKKNGKEMSWINTGNNWNVVCHGGMVAASLVIADENPELAAKTIGRALNNLNIPLKEYSPDGIYPEGPGYWGYGTIYTVLTSSMLTSAFGMDFGIAEYPALMKSADFILLATAPSGNFFNFSDCGLKRWNTTSVVLAWFAAKTGDGLYFDKTFFKNPTHAGRFAGPGLVWLSQFRKKKTSVLPLEWYGEGRNPVVFFRGGKDDPGQFYFAAKGGSASNNHSNMDAGTFVFELNGVRWVVDPGTQDYNELEQTGFNLWNTCQECQRWTLLTKGNQWHSTITVDNARHNVKGYAPITEFKAGKKPEVTGYAPITEFKAGKKSEVSIDLTEIFTGHLKSIQRKFIKESNWSLLIEDRFEPEDSTRNITWAIMTTADVIPDKDGAMLKQDGKGLKLSILSPENVQVSVISLDPPPLKVDKRIENLKRIEIRCPAYIFSKGKGLIQVRLSSLY